ncbi:hypothetical protein K432DRAFT_429370 [Lepidopterella palustris CBS 459.81]|uniref:Ap4A phosphorylase II n=1 Tax=Lepidopterella palustris CBS 459.81 TaxID=1314670 RepID=A0A8E2E1G5_9PEZI|nr:hypothetical protein K432DRAFT_429370 [Lepidopterella palustris CBS 459.81]
MIASMSPTITQESLLEAFDDLRSRNMIHYSPPRKIQVEHNGFRFEFFVTDSIKFKASAEQELAPISALSTSNPSFSSPDLPADRPICFGPGSDIAFEDPKLLIAEINETHLLVINKFCVFRPQLLLLTTDSFRRQHHPLEIVDFAAVCDVLSSLDSGTGKYFAIFNCCSQAGASREHKHLQILPRVGDFFPDDRDFDMKNIPFKYFLHYLEFPSSTPSSHTSPLSSVFTDPKGPHYLQALYDTLLGYARSSLRIVGEKEAICPHNVVLTKEWLLVIPRRSNNFKGVTANSAGMVGSVWLANEDQLEGWKMAGMTEVLAELGVPAESDNSFNGEDGAKLPK